MKSFQKYFQINGAKFGLDVLKMVVFWKDKRGTHKIKTTIKEAYFWHTDFQIESHPE